LVPPPDDEHDCGWKAYAEAQDAKLTEMSEQLAAVTAKLTEIEQRRGTHHSERRKRPKMPPPLAPKNDPAEAEKKRRAAAELRNTKAQTVIVPVPVPPDAPQPKGQLLDFIDALKKRRSGLAAKKATPPPARPAPAPAPPPASLSRQASADPQFGLGYGPPPEAVSGSAMPLSARSARAEAVSVPRPAPKVLARRTPPRPRRVRGLRIPSRRWRSLLYRLAIGLGVAGVAVAYQDRLPHIEGRGASVVSSQATDLAPTTRITGHKGAVTALASGDQGRWIVSAGADGTLRVWNAGSGALVRSIELDEGPATAIAVDDRRALTGHKGGAIVLWDLERAEKLGVFQNQQSAISALAFTGDADHFAAASQVGAVALQLSVAGS
jgi:hypothetical protein